MQNQTSYHKLLQPPPPQPCGSTPCSQSCTPPVRSRTEARKVTLKTKICTIYLARDVVAVMLGRFFTFNPILVVAVILGGIDPLAAELNRVGAGHIIDHLLLHVAVGCLHVSALVLILSGTTGSLALSQLEPYSWLAWPQPCRWPVCSLALSPLPRTVRIILVVGALA